MVAHAVTNWNQIAMWLQQVSALRRLFEPLAA
jgi:hypothetical protein